jgi:hypothetical protein
MRELQKTPRLPRLSVWIDGHGSCAVFLSNAVPKLRVDMDRLQIGLAQRGLRLAGVTRCSTEAVPAALRDLAECVWDGGDPIDAVLRLTDEARATPPHA